MLIVERRIGNGQMIGVDAITHASLAFDLAARPWVRDLRSAPRQRLRN